MNQLVHLMYVQSYAKQGSESFALHGDFVCTTYLLISLVIAIVFQSKYNP